jgi:hypothetical protein
MEITRFSIQNVALWMTAGIAADVWLKVAHNPNPWVGVWKCVRLRNGCVATKVGAKSLNPRSVPRPGMWSVCTVSRDGSSGFGLVAAH